MHSIQQMWAKWRMSFHVARKKRKKEQSFCHLAWPLWSERLLSSTVRMESFIWVVVFIFFFHLSVIGNCTFCSAETVWFVVVQHYAQHSRTWLISFRFTDSQTVPSLCSVLWQWISSVSLMLIWLEVKIVPSLFLVTFKAQFICVEAGLFSSSCVVDEKEKRRHMMNL